MTTEKLILTKDEMAIAVRRYARMANLTQAIVRGNPLQREKAIAEHIRWRESRKTNG